MRLTLISLAATAALFVVWLFAARPLTLLLDAIHTTPIDSPAFTTFRYDSSVLELGDTRLDFMTPDGLPTHISATCRPPDLSR